ncbi:DEAD/DEAH box helicase, partial [Acinetobacter baumannii]
MTSEMMNSRSRNFKSEHNNWLQGKYTVVVDESHLLTVPGRGDHLEAGLMKFSEINRDARLVLLSATMPNVKEIARWVSDSLTDKPSYLL